MQQFEAGFELFLGLGNLQDQALVRLWIAVYKGAINVMATLLRQHRKKLASCLAAVEPQTG